MKDGTLGPFYVARKGDHEAWAYVKSAKTIDVYVRNATSQVTLTIPIRTEILRRLASLAGKAEAQGKEPRKP